jgi:uncharacterized protein YqeY
MTVEEIKKDLTDAQKNRDEMGTSVLRMLLSAIINKQKDKRLYVSAMEPDLTALDLDRRENLDEEELMEVIVSEAKKRRDAIFSFEEGGRQDLLQKEEKELEFLKKYLPVELTEEEIKKIVKAAVAKTGATTSKDIGILMKEVIPQTKGRADGYLVSKIVKEELGN